MTELTHRKLTALNNVSQPFSSIRKVSEDKLLTLDYPNSKNEEWKYTKVTALAKKEFKTQKTTSLSALEGVIFPEMDTYTIVLENGILNKALSDLKNIEQGLEIFTLNSSELKEKASEFEKLFNKLTNQSAFFDILNTAKFESLLVFRIKPKVKLLKPISIVNIQTQEDIASVARQLIIAQEASEVSFINYFYNKGNGSFLQNLEEIYMAQEAKVDYTIIQDDCFQIASTNVHQESKSSFVSNTFTFDGKLVRNDLNIQVDGQEVETRLYGAYLARNRSHIDNHTSIQYKQSNCYSNEMYKGILDGGSTAVFNGKVKILKNAQKVNAFQQNDNIILDDNSSVNTKPQLEIFADDVKCSHGCTVGEFEKDVLFYLRSRGISLLKATTIMVNAFYDETLEGIKSEELKAYLKEALSKKILDLDDARRK